MSDENERSVASDGSVAHAQPATPDLAKRLRSAARAADFSRSSHLMEEAADAIVLLRQANEKLFAKGLALLQENKNTALLPAEKDAIHLAIECLHDQPHTAMSQTIIRAARDLRGLLDRNE